MKSLMRSQLINGIGIGVTISIAFTATMEWVLEGWSWFVGLNLAIAFVYGVFWYWLTKRVFAQAVKEGLSTQYERDYAKLRKTHLL